MEIQKGRKFLAKKEREMLRKGWLISTFLRWMDDRRIYPSLRVKVKRKRKSFSRVVCCSTLAHYKRRGCGVGSFQASLTLIWRHCHKFFLNFLRYKNNGFLKFEFFLNKIHQQKINISLYLLSTLPFSFHFHNASGYF